MVLKESDIRRIIKRSIRKVLKENQQFSGSPETLAQISQGICLITILMYTNLPTKLKKHTKC